jgi:AcrR family transcriptional regulator
MVMKKKSDRRPQRTRRLLSRALVGLITEKRFDDITVQNVIDRADVGRSTFYTHFRDKEDLLQKDWERFLDAFAQQIDWDKAGYESFVPVVHLFRHLQDVQPFYKGLVRSRKADSLFKTGVSYLSRKIETSFNARSEHRPPQTDHGTGVLATQSGTGESPTRQVPVPILANFLAIELFALLKWWLDHDMPYTPERMDEIYHHLVNPTFPGQYRERWLTSA